MKNIFKTSILFLTLIILNTSASAQENNSDEQFKKATNYFFQKKFEMAELLLKEVIKNNPENTTAYSYLGDIYLNKKQYDAALNLYLKSVELDPGPAENFFRMGQIHYFKKNGDLSVENYDKALARDNKLKIVLYHKGLTYLMLFRDKEKTIENWEKFITLSPEDPQYNSIKRILELLKDPDFKIPQQGSEVSIEEALLLGGETLTRQKRDAEDKEAGHEKKKSKTELEELYIDDDL